MPQQSNLTKVVLLLTSTLTVMTGAIVAPSLPGIAENLNASPLLSKLVLTVPALMIALLAPVMGGISDRFGRIKVLLFAMLMYGFFGTAAYFIKDIYMLLLSRAFFGVGVAGIITITISLVADYFSGDERNKFMGIQASFMAFGGMFFLSLAGIIADISWEMPFLLYIFGLVLLPFVLKHLKEPKSKSSLPSTSKDIPKTSLRIWIVYALGFLGMIYFYILPTQIPFLLSTELGSSNTQTGIAIAVATLTAAIASLRYARLKRRLSYSHIYSLSFFIHAVGFAIVYFTQNYSGVIIGLAVTGYGAGMLFPNGSLWLADLSPEELRGRIIGGFSSAVFLGQFFSPVVLDAVSTNISLWEIFPATAVAMAMTGIVMYFAHPKLQN